jgi:hypothetical protein
MAARGRGGTEPQRVSTSRLLADSKGEGFGGVPIVVVVAVVVGAGGVPETLPPSVSAAH